MIDRIEGINFFSCVVVVLLSQAKRIGPGTELIRFKY